MIFTKVRKARRSYWCEESFAHNRRIEPGDLYGLISVAPRHDVLGTGKWYSFPVCAGCLNPEKLLEYFINDRRGRALVAAIITRKESRK